MDQLTDDCQWLIIKYLKLEDQLALWEATEHSSNRLNVNIINAWQRQSKFMLNTEQIKENPKFLNILLRTIGPTVQHLILLNVTFEAMEHWCGYSFPNLQHLTYDMKKDVDNMTMKLMVELFPGLISLCPDGHFDCSIAAQWTQLRKLDLHDSFKDINASLKQFQMLEDISFTDMWLWSRKGDFDYREEVLGSILSLPRLQTLYITVETYDRYLINYITKMRGLDIQKIIFNDSIWNFDDFHLERLKNLRQFTLCDYSGYELEKLQSLVSVMPYLEQLHLLKFQIFRSEIELWQTVSLCPALNVLNISHMWLSADFFVKSRRFMLDVLSKRSSVLTLCCYKMTLYDTNSNEDLFRQNFQHSKLNLTFEPFCDIGFRNGFGYENCYYIQLVPLKT